VKFTPTSIPDVIVIDPKVFKDERGYFFESFRADIFSREIPGVHFIQDNESMSSYGVLRGLHYQIKQPQGKLVRVIRGEVFDVAVDLRKDSPRFGQWVGEYLSENNNRMLWVPPGFAHGFLVTSETADFQYKCTDFYAPEGERSIVWNDPEVGIDWGINTTADLLLSEKDSQGQSFGQAVPELKSIIGPSN
jgi:dTDP-4-dehydrorhamnose 3,5-epimerase